MAHQAYTDRDHYDTAYRYDEIQSTGTEGMTAPQIIYVVNDKLAPASSAEREHGTEHDAPSYPRPETDSIQWIETLKAWRLEILAIVLASGILVAQFIFIRAFDDRPMSDWPLSIGLTTLVAILSTVSRASLAFIVCEIVSQIQWKWSTSAVPLKDIEDFNHASRGMLGSLKLLLLSKKGLRRVDLLGALVVIIASVVMGPFSQQAVQTKECQVIDKTKAATIPSIRTLGWVSPQGQVYTNTTMGPLSLSTKAGIMQSLYDPNGIHALVRPTCGTQSCTFRTLQDTDGSPFTHRSLGLCNRCMDLSPLLQAGEVVQPPYIANDSTFVINNWTLPNAEYAVTVTSDWEAPGKGRKMVSSEFLTITSKHDMISDRDGKRQQLPGSEEYRRAIQAPLVQIDFVSVDDVAAGRPLPDRNATTFSVSATSCALFPCINTYRAFIQEDNLDEVLVSTEPLQAFGSRSEEGPTYAGYLNTEMIKIRTPCYVGDELYTSENITSAPGQITLTRWDYGEPAINYPSVWSIEQTAGMMDKVNPARKVNLTSPPECLYAMGLLGWYQPVRSQLQRALEGYCELSDGVVYCLGPKTAIGNGEFRYLLEGLGNLQKRSVKELSEYMDAVAESLTRQLRMRAGGGLDFGRNETGNEWRADAGKEAMKGDAWATTTCFRVELRWLILPAGLTLLTWIVLIWTIGRGIMRDEVVWKSSILPLVYYRERLRVVDQAQGAQGFPAPEGVPLLSGEQLEKDSKLVRVMLPGGR